jgi:hypothetical protein
MDALDAPSHSMVWANRGLVSWLTREQHVACATSAPPQEDDDVHSHARARARVYCIYGTDCELHHRLTRLLGCGVTCGAGRVGLVFLAPALALVCTALDLPLRTAAFAGLGASSTSSSSQPCPSLS